MLSERAAYYYNQCDTNCAETVLHCANDEWGLNLTPQAYKAICGFGAGIGCGAFCGAVAGAVAAVGLRHVEGRAHATEGFPERCAALLDGMREKLGALDCAPLKERYRTEEQRCLKTIQLALEVLQDADSSATAPIE